MNAIALISKHKSHILDFLFLKKRNTPGKWDFLNLAFRRLKSRIIKLNTPDSNPPQKRIPTRYAINCCGLLPLKFDLGINRKEEDDTAKHISLIRIKVFGLARFNHIPLSYLFHKVGAIIKMLMQCFV